VRLREITDAVPATSRRWCAKGMCSTSSPPDCPSPCHDSQLMRRVILNLVSNAIKYAGRRAD
jgi:K+-sensing histidine kinase KdpD